MDDGWMDGWMGTYLCDFITFERDPQLLAVLGTVDLHLFALSTLTVLAQQRALQPAHVVVLSVHQDNHLRPDLLNEARVLAIVDVCREAQLLNGASSRDHHLRAVAVAAAAAAPVVGAPVGRHDSGDFGRFVHDLLCHGALNAVAGYDEAVAGVGTPALEEFAGDAVLWVGGVSWGGSGGAGTRMYM